MAEESGHPLKIIDGATTDVTLEEITTTIKGLRQILINEFSFDGEDPKGLLVYQEEVDRAEYLINRLTVISRMRMYEHSIKQL